MHTMVWNNFRKGHIFFENDENVEVNVNGIQCRAMIENFLRSEVMNNPQLQLQQDGTTAHTTGLTMAFLREIFDD